MSVVAVIRGRIGFIFSGATGTTAVPMVRLLGDKDRLLHRAPAMQRMLDRGLIDTRFGARNRNLGAVAYRLRYDTAFGNDMSVHEADGKLHVGQIHGPWVPHDTTKPLPEAVAEGLGENDPRVLLDGSGLLIQKAASDDPEVPSAAVHLRSEANKGGVDVVVAIAPVKGADFTYVPGANDQGLVDFFSSLIGGGEAYTIDDSLLYRLHHGIVISQASCTTGCMAQVAMLMHQIEEAGIFSALQLIALTNHGETTSNVLIDQAAKPNRKGRVDLRRAQSVVGNIIPSSSGAATELLRVCPWLKEVLMQVSAYRVHARGAWAQMEYNLRLIKDLPPEDGATAEDKIRTLIGREIKTRVEDTSNPQHGRALVTDDPLTARNITRRPFDQYSAVITLPDITVTRAPKLGENVFNVRVLAGYDHDVGYGTRVVADTLPRVFRFLAMPFLTQMPDSPPTLGDGNHGA